MLWLSTRVIELGDGRDIDFLFPAVQAPESDFEITFRRFFLLLLPVHSFQRSSHANACVSANPGNN
jgi:hypothetical protein